jgi:lipase
VVLHVNTWGDPGAPAIVCLHGVYAHGRRFRRLAEERLAARFRVVAPDLRGHGRSDFEPPWDLDTHVADLLETVPDGGDWIGHSFGGRLALELAAREPGLVRRLVLLDPAIWVPPPVALERAEADRAERAFASPEEALESRIATARLAPRAALEEEVAEHLLRSEDGRWRWRFSQAATVAAYGEMAKPPPDFGEIRSPTLLVRGAETDVVPEVLVDACREGWGGPLEVLTVPGGHVPLWDAFDETADAVERFLEDGRP